MKDKTLKIVAISDTHGQYRNIKLPKGDVLIHAGDWDSHDRLDRFMDFKHWLRELDYEHKIVIAGNHELLVEDNYDFCARELNEVCTYLHSESTEINGIKFYGSPYTPNFNNWAFNKCPGLELAKEWAKIPYDTNVLITHGPPQFILDQITDLLDQKGWNLGDADLAARVKKLPELRLHIFGHIHTGHGILEQDGVKFVNASLLDEMYDLEYQATILEV